VITSRAALMIVPADMPELLPPSLNRLLREQARWPKAILAGAQGSRRGHPVLFPPDLVSDLARLPGDTGVRAVLEAHGQRLWLVPLPGRQAALDLDTP
jgi:molybdenum cofactor cytidylyltransferase